MDEYPDSIFKKRYVNHPNRESDELYLGIASMCSSWKTIRYVPMKNSKWSFDGNKSYYLFVKKSEIMEAMEKQKAFQNFLR